MTGIQQSIGGVIDIEEDGVKPVTGNILITYDADRLAEKDIFKWLESMAKIILNDIEKYTSPSKNNFESLLNRIKYQLTALEK